MKRILLNICVVINAVIWLSAALLNKPIMYLCCTIVWFSLTLLSINDELTLEIQKWNPAQELLISYIKECELTVFEAEKVHDFIRNEIKAKRYKRENT